uniref:NAD(P)H-quinone oxidoreductase subunit 2, chloroplastic n=1 Tax=Cibotium barometz TaxID=29588 RepID=A0A2S1PVA2_CIBBA|nr:NADH-plastoquinone oxidoreductase subunit 2 [Cibotium barometz]YP_010878701.1 NADH-plastoquinone oxidoreductase subunit 2 [Cibotium cumingii]WHE38156.1 NADH-plastoquinone oxidoreductase subunit 2 [Cibotium sinoburmaense]AWH62763.1 NADH-plastoquinone oxidoreductase subunit 2 [Cibotium barometz]WHE37893.1 NADH-plastoquinone oxidoreductase subunit 2 [Cibotium barometz]WHE37981.1 NADH-plastoquinone oxidoreductase subunit 2 [Cibotium barometz]WHE38068.1 NADH-plastoquinone oxidoreductase subunit
MNNIDFFVSLGNLSIFPEYILILSLITIIVIDLSHKGKDALLLHRISLISLLTSIVLLLCQWEVKSVPIAPESPQINTPSNIFRLFLLIRSLLSVSLSVDYVRCTKTALAEFSLFISTAGSGGMPLRCANDLVTIYVASECLSLSSYLLSGYAKKDIRSNEATMKFLLMGGASSSFLVYGFSLLYGLSGGEVQLNKVVDGLLSTQMYDSVAIYTSIAFVAAGMAFKPSLVPFHQWTPDVYEGSPTPVVAFFSVTSKVAALALSTRLFGIIFPYLSSEWHIALGVLATLSMILGNLIAVTQISMKRMLAYSSISQIGYIMIGILAADPENGYASMITYTFIHILMNLGTFARITSFGLRTGTDNIRDYAGLYMKDPVLTFSPVLRSPSLGGIPPPSGFFGKLYLFWHGWKAGSYPSVPIALVTSVISIYYYLKIIKLMFTGKNERSNTSTIYIQNSLVSSSTSISKGSIEIAMIIRALASILSGILIDPIIGITQNTLF